MAWTRTAVPAHVPAAAVVRTVSCPRDRSAGRHDLEVLGDHVVRPLVLDRIERTRATQPLQLRNCLLYVVLGEYGLPRPHHESLLESVNVAPQERAAPQRRLQASLVRKATGKHRPMLATELAAQEKVMDGSDDAAARGQGQQESIETIGEVADEALEHGQANPSEAPGCAQKCRTKKDGGDCSPPSQSQT